MQRHDGDLTTTVKPDSLHAQNHDRRLTAQLEVASTLVRMSTVARSFHELHDLAVDPAGYVVRRIVFDHMSLDW